MSYTMKRKLATIARYEYGGKTLIGKGHEAAFSIG